MEWWHILLIVIASLILITLVISFISFRITFYSPNRKNLEKFSIPDLKLYENYRDIMFSWMSDLRAKEFEPVEIISFDGLKLRGKFYKGDKDAPFQIMFHGYRGSAERDMCGGVRRCFNLNHNILLIDHRASGYSDGNVITFGINERKDALSWINYITNTYGDDVKIILTGISMGASTILMAAGEKLPKNVVAIIADSGYSTPKGVICETIKKMHLPNFMYIFVKMGGIIFGRFNIDETTPLKALENSNIPILIFHGNNDSVVPSYMALEIYNAIKGPKKLVKIENCDHGLGYIIDEDMYIKELDNFFKEFNIDA